MTFGIKYDSYTHIKFFIMSIIITYYHHFHDHVLTFISITNILYFLKQVYSPWGDEIAPVPGSCLTSAGNGRLNVAQTRSLKKMKNIIENDIVYNEEKTKCMRVKPSVMKDL